MIEREGQSAAPSADRFFLIGELVVDTQRNVVLRDGQAVRVEPRVMAVLNYLAAADGRIVSRDELMAKVWGTNVVDEAVQRSISLLRTALGGDSRTAFLETVPGQGYRLLVSPRPLAAASAAPGSPAAGGSRWLVAALAVVLLVTLAAAALYFAPREQAHVAPKAPPAQPGRAPAVAPKAPQ